MTMSKPVMQLTFVKRYIVESDDMHRLVLGSEDTENDAFVLALKLLGVHPAIRIRDRDTKRILQQLR